MLSGVVINIFFVLLSSFFFFLDTIETVVRSVLRLEDTLPFCSALFNPHVDCSFLGDVWAFTGDFPEGFLGLSHLLATPSVGEDVAVGDFALSSATTQLEGAPWTSCPGAMRPARFVFSMRARPTWRPRVRPDQGRASNCVYLPMLIRGDFPASTDFPFF